MNVQHPQEFLSVSKWFNIIVEVFLLVFWRRSINGCPLLRECVHGVCVHLDG